MRYLVVALIAANLLFYFLYPHPQDGGDQRVREPALPAGAQRLVLLSERPSTERASANETQPPQQQDRPEHAPATDTAAEPSVTGGEDTFTAGPDTAEAQEYAAEVDAAAAGEETVADEHLAEADQPVGEADTAAASVVETAGQEAAPAPACYMIGPFVDEPVAADIAARLENGGYAVTARSGNRRMPSGYWVYLPSMPAAEARRTVADLKARGIKDYFVGKQNYISLGIFSRKDQARRRQRQIAALGYDAVLDRRYRSRLVHWMDISGTGESLADSELWGEILQKHPDAPLKEIDCE